MKIRLLFLICIELIVMFPRPGMQHTSYAKVEVGAKQAFYKGDNKSINQNIIIMYSIAERKKDNRSCTINVCSTNNNRLIIR